MAEQTRNTLILQEILSVLDDQAKDKEAALAALEHHFRHRLIIDAGDVHRVAAFAKQLRLRINQDECSLVLNYIASKSMVGITVDHVETAINELLGEDRFIEPGQ